MLLAAAALKLIGWNVAPFAQYGWLLTPTVQTAAVAWEVILGGWLLTSVTPSPLRGGGRGVGSPSLPWFLAVLTFLAFATVSGYLGLIGQANCGCFGLIQASPWAAFTVDLVALGLLALGRPAKIVDTLRVPIGLIGVIAALALLAGLGTLAFGSLDAAIAKLRGEPLGVSPAVLDFGTGKPGESLSTSVTVRNFTTDPVRLIGGTSDCSCLVTQDLPVTIPPGESVSIAVKLKVPGGTPGQMTRWVEVFTDCPGQRTVRLTATCRVTE
ncbi:MAG: DUF1573 domain-containing protein [Gemmataceae bacterium]